MRIRHTTTMCRAELAWRLPPRLRRWRCEAINRDLAAGARGYVKALRMKRWRENRPSNCPAWISCSCGRAIQSNSASIASGAMPSTRLLTTSVRCSPSSGRPVPGSRAITRQAEMLQPGVNDIDTPVAVALRRSVGHEPLVAPPAGLQRDRGHRHVYRRRAPGTHGGCPDHRAHRDGPSVPRAGRWRKPRRARLPAFVQDPPGWCVKDRIGALLAERSITPPLVHNGQE